MINYDPNQEYCIYLGGLQTGKDFVFKSIRSDSIHLNKRLTPNAINILSYTTVYELKNIIGLSKILNACKPKLVNPYILEQDFPTAILKHINDIIRNYDNPSIMSEQNIKFIIKNILYSHYFLLKFLKENNIDYQYKNILSLKPGEINITEFFSEEIQKYQIPIIKDYHNKIDYEWSIEKLKEEIYRNLLNNFNIKSSYQINLNNYIEWIQNISTQCKKLYELEAL